MHAHTRRFSLALSGGLTTLLALTPVNVFADTITVCWDGSGDYVTIQAGIDAAVDGDEVVVCDGTYTGPGNKDLDFHGKAITVRSANGPDNCIIDCERDGRGIEFGSAETSSSVVDGFAIINGYALFGGGIHCGESSPIIRNCTIEFCEATGEPGWYGGGGIHCSYHGNPTIVDCLIRHNVAHHGGGISAYQGDPVVTGCVVSGNSALGYGGGIRSAQRANVLILDSTIAENTAAADGGGVFCIGDAQVTIIASALTENVASIDGGGIYCAIIPRPSVSVADCTIVGNVARDGGALCSYGGIVQLTNTTLAGNTATDDGGALLFGSDSIVTIANCTFMANQAADDGGAVFCENDSTVTVTNCIIAGNTASAGGAFCFWQDTRAILTNCTIAANSADNGTALCCDSWLQGAPSTVGVANCVFWNGGDEIWNNDESTIGVNYSDVAGGWPGAGNIDVAPLFVDPDGPDDDPNTWEDNDFHLAADSPCIDAGCNGAVPADVADLDEDGDTEEITPLDLDGEGRFFDDPGTPDSGCGIAPVVDMGAYEFGDAGPQPCPGDLDGDRDVDQSDLGILLSLWGASDACDLDCDGDVDQGDLGILLANWGIECP